MSTQLSEPTVDADALRQKTADAARRHKASWIELGQYLFTIYQDKHFKTWGHLTFEAYCIKELGMKQTTASKLLKSYFFLEKEEPKLVKDVETDNLDNRRVPNYESVNLLRLAKENQELSAQEYAGLRESVIEKAREPKDVRAQMKQIMSEKNPGDPAEERKKRRNAAIKRTVSVLNMVRREMAADNLLPDYLVKQMADLVSKLSDQIEE